MITLDTTTKSLEVAVGSVPATQLDWVASWADTDPAVSPQVLTPGGDDGVTNSTTPVTLVAAPAAGKQRGVDYLSVANGTAGPLVVHVQLNNGTSTRVLWKGTLQALDVLQWNGRAGWSVLDGNGRIKSGAAGGLALGMAVSGGTAGRVLFEDASANLADDAGLTYSSAVVSLAGTLTLTGGGGSVSISNSGTQTDIVSNQHVDFTVAGVLYCSIGNNFLAINGVSYAWPAAHAIGNVYNDGAGNLSWTLGGPVTTGLTTLGTLIGARPAYNPGGSLIGQIPVYDTIT